MQRKRRCNNNWLECWEKDEPASVHAQSSRHIECCAEFGCGSVVVNNRYDAPRYASHGAFPYEVHSVGRNASRTADPSGTYCAARSGGRNANHGAHRNANRDVAGNTRSLGQPQRRSLQLLGEARRLIVLSTSTIQGAFSFSETARPHIMMPFLYRWPILNGRIVVHSSVIHH